MKGKTFRDLPLAERVRTYGRLTSALLLFTLILGFCIVIYVMLRFDHFFGMSYTQSSLLNNVGELNAAVEEYGAYPGSEAGKTLGQELHEVKKGVRQLGARSGKMTDEQLMLLAAVTNTCDTYGGLIERLLEFPAAQEQPQDFYLCYDETMEAGGYVDLYLEQLIQETLSAGRAEYGYQLSLIKWGPFVLVALFVLSAGLNKGFQRMVSEQIVTPVLRLAQASRVLAAREMRLPDLPVEGRDEIGELTENFNHMKEDLRGLMETRAEKMELEKRLASAQFTMLKNQMNPHFLFNALNLISQTAGQESAAETQELIGRLSELLRYNLYQTQDWIALQEELDVLHSYMYIQESRFGERLVFWVECELDAGRVMVPSFMLQPLVENSVSHGISPKEEGGMVRVKITERGGIARISVTDNGVGIGPEELALLRAGRYKREKKREGKKKSGGIGLENVAVRFSMLFPEGHFQILSRRGMGTSIIMRFPIREAPGEHQT